MRRVLAITDAMEDVEKICRVGELVFFKIRQLPTEQHSFENFEAIYRRLKDACDLSSVDVVIAEYVESLPILYFMRRDGYQFSALMIPHTNPYPLNILLYFLLLSAHPHPGDVVVCGSTNAARAYEKITTIPAKNICTFGIKSIYQKRDRTESRRHLNLPLDRPVLLYTGRFMNDKGLAPLLIGYHRLREEIRDLLLVMSVTHIDILYYNQLAPMLENVVLFQRLDREETAWLYNSADVYVSGATSIFETYGKAPLEALACGVPVVVPQWDGFPYYVDNSNGALVDVDYHDHACSSPYDFATMRVDDFVVKCQKVLGRSTRGKHDVPEWARYENTIDALSSLVDDIATTGRSVRPPALSDVLEPDRYPVSVRKVLDFYGITSARDILLKGTRAGLIDRRNPGDTAVLRALHDDIFTTMTSVDEIKFVTQR